MTPNVKPHLASAWPKRVITMAYDEQLAIRVRRVLAGRRDIEEKAMFGGLAFMARGHMCCGLVQAKLMVRVDPQAYDRLRQESNVRPMDFTGRPMRGFLYVEPNGIASAPALRKWIGRALAFAESLPQKTQRGIACPPRCGLTSVCNRRRSSSRRKNVLAAAAEMRSQIGSPAPA